MQPERAFQHANGKKEKLLYLSIVSSLISKFAYVPWINYVCITYDSLSFQWDPMITTLPGLYLVTVGILRPLTLLLGADMVCSVTGFRLINILFQSGTFYVLKAIYGLIHSTPTAERVSTKNGFLNSEACYITISFYICSRCMLVSENVFAANPCLL